jgi:hypothetical protein
MTKKNSFVRTFSLVQLRRKTGNNAGLKREPKEYSLSNISGYASEFILSLFETHITMVTCVQHLNIEKWGVLAQVGYRSIPVLVVTVKFEVLITPFNCSCPFSTRRSEHDIVELSSVKFENGEAENDLPNEVTPCP